MRGTAAEAAAYSPTVDERIAAKRAMTIRDGDARDVLEALKGKSADATLPAGTAPIAPAPVMQPIDDGRATLIGRALHLLHGLDVDDLRVRVAMLEQGSHDQVRARCEAITREGAEPALLPDGSLPTNKLRCDGRDNERHAHALHLGALRAWRLIVLGPGRRDR